MSAPRNPTALVALDRDPALRGLLRACGADAACLTGKASDYDAFIALADALPLCEGHPLRDTVQAILQAATGLTAPLCPHTAQAYWRTWTERNWYGRSPAPAPLPAHCPHCAPVAPTILHERETVTLPCLETVKAPDLSAWTAKLQALLEAALPPVRQTAALPLPEDYAFVRPDPYHAGQAIRRIADGDVLSPRERDLLYAQALRVWGMMGEAHPFTLLLRGGAPEAVLSLLDYLQGAKALPNTVWVPDSPADAGAVSGRYERVTTGYAVFADDPPGIVKAIGQTYAAVAPIGRAVVVIQERTGAP